jgi:predicted MFS family arabinose efflux permease
MTLLSRRDAIFVFLAFAFAYFLSALMRGITATLSPTLTQEFALNARDLGLLAGGYFLGFAFTQLPLGKWLDRYGSRQVVLYFLSVGVVGCVAFSFATSFSWLLAARVLIGVGVSASLMAALTGYRHWFDPATTIRANSWMLMTGSMGMVASTLPVQWLAPVFGWRPLFWGLAGLLMLSMVALAWHAPRRPDLAAGKDAKGDSADTGSYAPIWRHPFFRCMAPVGFICYGGLLAMQTLWASPWMVKIAGYSPLEAATGLFWINVTMLCTFWTWGLINPWLARRGVTAATLIARGLPLSFLLLSVIILGAEQLGGWTAAAFAAYCMSCSFITLAHPAMGLAFPPALTGRALSAYNLVIFAGVFVMQWGIGLVIDLFLALGWTQLGAFRGAWSVFLACCIGAYLYFLAARPDNQNQ